MKFYLASSLENAAQVKRLDDFLVARGHECTYRWHVHGAVFKPGVDPEEQPQLPLTAFAELNGVIEANVVIALMPGGKGTHAELGAALATATIDSMVAHRVVPRPHIYVAGLVRPTEKPCVFWHHPFVRRRIWNADEAALFNEIAAAIEE